MKSMPSNDFTIVIAEIQKLVLSGRMGEAIETTQQLYPSLLEKNPDLLFMLKWVWCVQFYKNGHLWIHCIHDVSVSLSRVRQFIEMVNGTDSEVRCLGGRSPKSQDSYPGSPRLFNSPVHKASSSQAYQTGTWTTYTLKRLKKMYNVSFDIFSQHGWWKSYQKKDLTKT